MISKLGPCFAILIIVKKELAIENPFFLLFILGLVTSFISTFFGVGGGTILLLCLSYLYPANVCMPLFLLTQFSSDLFRAFDSREHIHWEFSFKYCLPGFLIALVVAPFYIPLPINIFRVALGFLMLFSLWRPKKLFSIGLPSSVQGSFTTLSMIFIGVAGPLIGGHLLERQLKSLQYISTKAMIQAFLRILAIFVLVCRGEGQYKILSLPILILIIGSILGNKLGKTIMVHLMEKGYFSEQVFKVAISVLASKIVLSSMLNLI